MRVLLLLAFCTLSLSASAQWWNFKHRRYPQLEQAQSPAFKLGSGKMSNRSVARVDVGQTMYNLKVSERQVMRTAQHNMRFREYAEASYNFRDLAKIYIRLNQLSQAKWFFLQSNNLSRQQSNDRLTIANLIDLALIKSTIGDFALAQQDLDEARSMALTHGWQDDLTAVDKEINNLQHTKLAALKPGASYAGTAQSAL